ncbi:MAG TPA: hypothetical protein PLK63_16705 [Catalimonadaceae bacterium]|nr:hypothetical protein [Catalimonadaceae bacterium]
MQIKLRIFLVVISFLLQGCPEKNDSNFDSIITIINNSEKTLIYSVADVELGDTSLPLSQPYPSNFSNRVIEKKSTHNENGSFIFDLRKNENSVTSVFVFDTLKKYEWELIRKNKKYEKKFTITLDSFDHKNHVVLFYP